MPRGGGVSKKGGEGGESRCETYGKRGILVQKLSLLVLLGVLLRVLLLRVAQAVGY